MRTSFYIFFRRLLFFPVLCGLFFLSFSNPNILNGDSAVLGQATSLSAPKALLEAPVSVAQAAAVQPAAPAPKATTGLMSIDIRAISIQAPVTEVGLEKNGELHVPSNTVQAGWYEYGPLPGEAGAAVITGHLNFGPQFQAGVFANLNKIQLGDEIKVTRPDGSVAVFSVDQMQTFSQDAFPTQLVYNSTSDAELRLITCAGTYDKKTGRYTRDLVVFAKLVNLIPAEA